MLLRTLCSFLGRATGRDDQNHPRNRTVQDQRRKRDLWQEHEIDLLRIGAAEICRVGFGFC